MNKKEEKRSTKRRLGMTYFSLLSIIWGILIVTIRSFIHLIPERWKTFELETVYKEKKPSCIPFVTIGGIALVAFTWYKELTTDVDYSLFVTILLTLTLVKIGQLTFNYTNFRRFVYRALVEDRRMIVWINIATTMIGSILILLGLLVY